MVRTVIIQEVIIISASEDLAYEILDCDKAICISEYTTDYIFPVEFTKGMKVKIKDILRYPSSFSYHMWIPYEEVTPNGRTIRGRSNHLITAVIPKKNKEESWKGLFAEYLMVKEN